METEYRTFLRSPSSRFDFARIIIKLGTEIEHLSADVSGDAELILVLRVRVPCPVRVLLIPRTDDGFPTFLRKAVPTIHHRLFPVFISLYEIHTGNQSITGKWYADLLEPRPACLSKASTYFRLAEP